MKGSRHFLAQRISAIVLLPLVVWFCFGLASLPGASHAAIVGWLQQPVNALLMAAFLISGISHGRLGMQVVIEDYFSPGRFQRVLLWLLQFLQMLLLTLGLFFLFTLLWRAT